MSLTNKKSQDETVHFESKITELIGPFHDDGETPIILQVVLRVLRSAFEFSGIEPSRKATIVR